MAARKNLMRMAVRQRPEGTRLSARSYHRVLKLGRTIADLGGREADRRAASGRGFAVSAPGNCVGGNQSTPNPTIPLFSYLL